MHELKRKLVEFGLSDKESNVYLAMLELGPSSVQDIAKKGGVNRATTYVMIEALKRRGLVSSVEHGKKTFFASESPQHLLGIVGKELREAEEKKQRLENLMPQFMGLFNGIEDKPKVRYFEGEEGLIACREAVFELAKVDRSARVFIHYDQAMLDSAKHHESQRLKLTSGSFSARILYSIEAGMTLPLFGKNVEVKQISEQVAPFHGECAIYQNFILVASVRTRTIAVIIESLEIARLFQSFFDLAWMAASFAGNEKAHRSGADAPEENR